MGLGALFLSFLFETSFLAITAIVLVLHEYVLMGFVSLHSTSDDKLIKGQNINMLKIYLNKLFS
jgi:hypothetical protein